MALPRGDIVPNLSWMEFVHTDKRKYLPQQLDPPQTVIRNARRHGETLWSPVRRKVGRLLVTSGYRCIELNKEVGGAALSRHILGLATDNVPLDMPLFDAYMDIAEDEDIHYDQLIFEYGVWIHLGSALTSSMTPRRVKLMKWPGTDHYEPWDPADPRVQEVKNKRFFDPFKVNGSSP